MVIITCSETVNFTVETTEILILIHLSITNILFKSINILVYLTTNIMFATIEFLNGFNVIPKLDI